MFLYVYLRVCMYLSVCLSCRFDKELADIMKEMKKGGVLEVRKKPVPPLTSLTSIDSRHWQGLNTSFLHTHYPGLSVIIYLTLLNIHNSFYSSTTMVLPEPLCFYVIHDIHPHIHLFVDEVVSVISMVPVCIYRFSSNFCRYD